uniref:Hexosyltransferase n=1 Tax=Rhizophora mucronata TaxID=61149 RepID=A0A2P2MK62_RHIMU
MVPTASSTGFFLEFLPEAKHLSGSLIVGNNVTIFASYIIDSPFILIPNFQALLLHVCYPNAHCYIF